MDSDDDFDELLGAMETPSAQLNPAGVTAAATTESVAAAQHASASSKPRGLAVRRSAGDADAAEAATTTVAALPVARSPSTSGVRSALQTLSEEQESQVREMQRRIAELESQEAARTAERDAERRRAADLEAALASERAARASEAAQLRGQVEAGEGALGEARRATKAIKARVKDAMRAKLKENEELTQRTALLARKVEELEGTQKALRQVAGEHADAAEESKVLEKEVLRLSKQLDKSEKEVARLEARVGRGDFDSTTTRVVHFKALPPSKHRGPRSVESLEGEIRKLRKENEALRAAVAAAGSGGSGGAASFAPFNSSPSVSSASMAQFPATPAARHAGATPHAPAGQKTECSGCASKNKSYESLVKKTRDVFQHYRAVVYELTGYRISVRGDVATLESMFAETPSDNIKFRLKKPSSSGSSGGNGGGATGKVEFELLDTPFMNKPAAQNALLVLQLNSSWPAFLAGITQALMEDVTVM